MLICATKQSELHKYLCQRNQAIRKLDLQGVCFFSPFIPPETSVKRRNIHENKETIQNEDCGQC